MTFVRPILVGSDPTGSNAIFGIRVLAFGNRVFYKHRFVPPGLAHQMSHLSANRGRVL